MLSWQKTPALYYRLLSGQISSGAEEVVWSYNGRFILNDVIATSSTSSYIKLFSGQMSVDQSDAFLVAIELDRSFQMRQHLLIPSCQSVSQSLMFFGQRIYGSFRVILRESIFRLQSFCEQRYLQIEILLPKSCLQNWIG